VEAVEVPPVPVESTPMMEKNIDRYLDDISGCVSNVCVCVTRGACPRDVRECVCVCVRDREREREREGERESAYL
jgi:hypothetical protein